MKEYLCCVLSPEVRCIGCNIPLCKVEWDKVLRQKMPLSTCEYSYQYDGWVHVEGNHAFTTIDHLENCKRQERELVQ
jgi:hypothetical protein